MVPRRGRLRAARARVRRQRRRRHRRLRGAHPQARLPAGPRHHRDLAAAVLPVAAARRGLRHLRLPRHQPRVRQPAPVPALPRRGAPARPARHHRAGAQPHLRPASVVPAGAARADRGSRYRNWYVWSDDPTVYRDARIIFRDFERSNWSWDDVAEQYYWHRFYSHQPDLNFDNPEVRREMLRTIEYWLEHGRRRAPPRRGAVPVRARRHELREPAGDARLPARDPQLDRRALRRPHAARRGEPVARGRGRVLRRRRRVPDGVPLPADAPAVHGPADGGPVPDRRHPAPDPAAARRVPVGRVPAQPRRAHARDGHRRRARLHVPRVRARPVDAHQPRASGAGSRRCCRTTATRSS